ncbi:MAG TPA: biotin/lipoyl-binding carrier protein [Xanthobacteraceae bacterium]|jgi:acetyl-CoA carboxylase biotin carboxyl carrier protein|nr:biotin/lipoyl-binding carrier protein [Xanthobacteraceae bacterium]
MAEMPVLSELNAVVLKIEVAPGDRVEEGETLIVLESMKMEIPVSAPRAGTVAAILVQEKQIVEEGQKIAVLGA